jgi:hypothetical protein
MTKRQFVVLVFRLFALYLILNLLTTLPYIFNLPHLPGEGLAHFLLAGFTIFIAFALISLLWRNSEWLMQKVFAIPALADDIKLVEEESVTEGQVEGLSERLPDVIEIQDYYETPLTKESVEVIAFSVVGLWATFTYLPHLLRDIEMSLMTKSFAIESISINLLLPDLIQLALGIWLFLRPWQFQGWIEKIKARPKNAEA